MNVDLKPCVIAATEAYDYDVRAEALRIIRGGAIDLAHHKFSDVVMCLSSMAFAGLMEYYGGWAFDLADSALVREHGIADDLAHIEAKLLQTHEGTEDLKAKVKAELAQYETETRAAMDAGRPLPQAQARLPQLPPGIPVSMTMLRGLAIMRQRDREEQ